MPCMHILDTLHTINGKNHRYDKFLCNKWGRGMGSNAYSERTLIVHELQKIIRNLRPYPFKAISGIVHVGGVASPSLSLTTVLDKGKYARYAQWRIGSDGVMEQTNKHHVTGFRKTKIKSTHDIIVELHVWAETNPLGRQ